MPNHLSFDELRSRRAALVDVSSITEICDNWSMLVEPIRGIENAERMVLRLHGRARQALQTLTHLALFDHVAVDRESLKSVRRTTVVAEPLMDSLLSTTDIPDSIVLRTLRDLRDDIELAAHVLAPLDNNDSALPGMLQMINRFAASPFGRIASLDNDHVSSDTPARAYLYLGASSSAKVPALLGRRKEALVEQLDDLMGTILRTPRGTEVMMRVLRVLQDKVSKPISSSPQGLRTCAMLEMPPVDRYLLHTAAQRGCSLLDAAAIVRNDPYASAFRQWLWDIQQAIISPSPAIVATGEKALRAFERIAEDWGRELDPKLHVKYEPRILNLESIPAIGFLFKAFGTINVNDPILNPQRHLVFMSNLFHEPPE